MSFEIFLSFCFVNAFPSFSFFTFICLHITLYFYGIVTEQLYAFFKKMLLYTILYVCERLHSI